MRKCFTILSITLIFLLINLSPALAVNNPRNTYEVKPGDYL